MCQLLLVVIISERHVKYSMCILGNFLFCSRYLTGQVDKRTLEKYEREAKEKNRETWLVPSSYNIHFCFCFITATAITHNILA